MESQIIWFFDHFNPYFQVGNAILAALCAGFCFWSAARRPTPGIIILGFGSLLAAVQVLLFSRLLMKRGQS
jgi:hypothetical protein